MTEDFTVSCHGSVYLLTPVTECAQEWANDHLPEDAQRFGHAYVIEWRYLDAILDGISDYVVVPR